MTTLISNYFELRYWMIGLGVTHPLSCNHRFVLYLGPWRILFWRRTPTYV